MSQKTRVAVIFGGRSPEHEVSIITAVQAMAAFPPEFEVIPLYVTKEGAILTGNHLRSIDSYRDLPLLTRLATAVALPSSPEKNVLIPVKNSFFSARTARPFDVIFPCFHGGVGEGGWIQGLAEYYQIPMVGTGLTGAVLGMDKVAMKHLFAHAGLKQAPFLWFTRGEWQRDQKNVLKKITSAFRYPIFVKPSRGGSSIGTTRITNKEELTRALDLSASMDTRLVVEQGIEGAREINLSVMGIAGGELETSVCEEVFHGDDFLDFHDKYLGGGKSQGMASTDRVIPAKISPALNTRIEEIGKTIFNLLDLAGLVRIDFLVKGKDIYVIEVNTIPGCLSFYIWAKSGYTYPALITRLVELALKKHKEEENTITDFSSPILTQMAGNSKLGSKLSRKE